MNSVGTLPDSDAIPRQPTPLIEAGTIGWEGDSDVAELGSADNDGTTLVKVQLYRGIDPLQEPSADGSAQGHKILARLSGFPFWAIPPKGMQCFVAFPAGFATTPGVGVIIALPGANPFVQFSASRAKIDVGRDQDLVIKGRSVTLVMHNPDDPNGQEDFISISPEGGLQMGSRDGLGVVIKDGTINLFVPDGDDAKSVLRLSKSAIELVNKDSGGTVAMVKVAEQDVTVCGGQFVAATAGGALGMGAGTAATGVAYGVAGPVNTMSATWTVSP